MLILEGGNEGVVDEKDDSPIAAPLQEDDGNTNSSVATPEEEVGKGGNLRSAVHVKYAEVSLHLSVYCSLGRPSTN